MLAEAQRRSMLQAMGIEVHRLRATAAATAAPAPDGESANVVVICVGTALPEHLRTRLPRALGVGAQRVRWCDSAAGLPENAAAYVAVGTAAARAVGEQLSTMQQNSSIIVTTAEAAALLRGGAARRALWQVLKPVARCLRERA